MARSISFILDDNVDTQIKITEQADGTLLFEIEVLDTGRIGDLRALYFDLEGVDVDTLALQATGDDVTDTAFDEAGVDNLGWGTGIGHQVTNALGDFDVGIEFGTITPWLDDIQQTSFVLSADSALSLDMLNLADIGVRYGSVEGIFGWRLFPERTGGEASGVAQDDVLTVDEGGSESLDLLANDTGGAGRTVTAVDGNIVVGPSGGFEVAVTVDGKTYGTLQVATDGTASFTADGPDAAALEDGESVVFATAYETVGADGSTASAGLEIVVNGLGTPNSDPVTTDELYYETDADAVLHSADLMRDDTNSLPVLVFDEVRSVLDNDGDPDGDTLTVSAVEGSAAGVGAAVALASGALVTMNADGTFDYDPNGAFDDLGFGAYAEDSFEYTVSDGNGGSATATATVTVGGVGAFDTGLAPIDFEDVTTDPAALFTTHAGFAFSASGGVGAATVDFLEALPDSSWDALVHTMLNQTGGEYLVLTNDSFGSTISVTSEDGSDFDFAGGWVGARIGTTFETLARFEPTYLTVSGYRDGVLVGSETAVATVDDPAAFIALDLQDIDLLVFDSSGSGSVVVDDLYMMT